MISVQKAGFDKSMVAFQILLVFFSLSGVAVNVWVGQTTFARLNTFSFYTIQSNLLVAAALLLGMRYRWVGKPEPRAVVIFKSGALLWILVTGVVYNLFLAGTWQPQGAMLYVDLSLHYATPVGMALNWLVFEKKGQYKPVYLLAWMAYPLLYLTGSWVRAALTGIYPYWFLNPTEPYPQGAGSLPAMLGIVGILVLGFLLGGLLILIIDRLAARRRTV
jgi:hypothetical protein